MPLDPDEAMEQAREDRALREKIRQDWRAGDPRFHQDIDDKKWYICTPLAYFSGEEQQRLDETDMGWRRIWKPERYFQLYGRIDSTWSSAQRSRLLKVKDDDWGRL